MLYVGIALFGAGLLAVVLGLLSRLKAKKILSAPVAQTGQIASQPPADLVSCEGAARAQQPMAAPCSSTPCVYYRLKLEKKVKETRGNQTTTSWKLVSDQRQGVFYVDDGSGGVWVQPDGLEADLTRSYAGPLPANLMHLATATPPRPGEQI